MPVDALELHELDQNVVEAPSQANLNATNLDFPLLSPPEQDWSESLDQMSFSGDNCPTDKVPMNMAIPVAIPVKDPEDIHLNKLMDLVTWEEVQHTMAFIKGLENASLEDPDTGLDPDALEYLWNPPEERLTINDPDFHLSLDLYLATNSSSDATYESVWSAVLHQHPDDDILTHYRIKQKVADITGIEFIVHHMCINLCLAYTGPFIELEHCPTCGEPHFDQAKLLASGGKSKVPQQEFHTIPLSPQLQVLWQDPDKLKYWDWQTQEAFEELEQNNGFLDSYDDFLHGSTYLQAVADGKIMKDDMASCSQWTVLNSIATRLQIVGCTSGFSLTILLMSIIEKRL